MGIVDQSRWYRSSVTDASTCDVRQVQFRRSIANAVVGSDTGSKPKQEGTASSACKSVISLGVEFWAYETAPTARQVVSRGIAVSGLAEFCRQIDDSLLLLLRDK